MEEIKHDCLYEDLNPKYWQVLVHKVDGENWPAPNCMKTGKKGRAQGHSSPKDSCNQWIECNTFSDQGNLFPLYKLKDNHTFSSQVVTIGNAEGKADSDKKQEGEGEMEPSVAKEFEVSGGVEGTDQPKEFIICFAKVVKLYQQKTEVSGSGVPTVSCTITQKTIANMHEKWI